MASAKRMVTVYDKNGKSYVVDHLNALDMTASLGFTYQPGRKFDYHEPLPYAGKNVELLKRDPQGKSLAQGILDGIRDTEEAVVADDTDEVFDAGKDVAPEPESLVIPSVEVEVKPDTTLVIPTTDEVEEVETPAFEIPVIEADAEVKPRSRTKKA